MTFSALWATFCHREGLGFEAFSIGMDIAIQDLELWSERGFAQLRDAVYVRQERSRIPSEDRKERRRGYRGPQAALS